MDKALTRLRAWQEAWHEFRQKLTVNCGCCGRIDSHRSWRALRRQPHGVRLQGLWYCQADCLQWALAETLGRWRPGSPAEATMVHRIPLGLLMLSRKQLTASQLRIALEQQRTAGHGRIGDWLQQLGFANEGQVTSALARQWSCPVLRASLEIPGAGRFIPIPLRLLESSRMMPVEFAEARKTLLIAFSEGIDHTALYAIEQMLGYRTDACLVCPSTLRKGLQALAQRRAVKDVVFDRVEDAGECVRIIGSYAAKVGAEEVRLAQCGKHIWIRLEGRRRETVNLVLRAPVEIISYPKVYPRWQSPEMAV